MIINNLALADKVKEKNNMNVNKIDKDTLSTFMLSNSYPQRLEDVQTALEGIIPRIKGKMNALNANRALVRIKEALMYIDRLPQY